MITISTTSNAEQSFNYDDFLRFYKRIFGIFYAQSHLPLPIDENISKLSHFLNRNILPFSLIYSTFFAWASHFSYCQPIEGSIEISVIIFFVLNTVTTSISLLSLVFRFEDVKKLWCELKCLDRLILKRINYTNNYLKFRRSFIVGPVLFPFLMLSCSICATVKSPLDSGQMTAILLQFVHFYVKLHVIFVISLFRYMYKMFSESINFTCDFRRLNSHVANMNRIDAMIRHSKEIHYKFWIVSHEVNNIFGTSVGAFALQTFIDATRFLCYIFYSWENWIQIDNITLTSLVSVWNFVFKKWKEKIVIRETAQLLLVKLQSFLYIKNWKLLTFGRNPWHGQVVSWMMKLFSKLFNGISQKLIAYRKQAGEWFFTNFIFILNIFHRFIQMLFYTLCYVLLFIKKHFFPFILWIISHGDGPKNVFLCVISIGPICSFLSTVTSTTILINACHYCQTQVNTDTHYCS